MLATAAKLVSFRCDLNPELIIISSCVPIELCNRCHTLNYICIDMYLNFASTSQFHIPSDSLYVYMLLKCLLFQLSILQSVTVPKPLDCHVLKGWLHHHQADRWIHCKLALHPAAKESQQKVYNMATMPICCYLPYLNRQTLIKWKNLLLALH